MKKYDIFPMMFWMGMGLFVTVYAYTLGLKGFHDPGPGLMPFIVGLLLCLVSLYLLVTSLLKRDAVEETNKGEEKKVSLGAISLVVGSLIAYALLMERLGFLITTPLLLMALFRGSGARKWRSIVFTSILTSLIVYFAFTYLRVRLPPGILRF
jgi:putative tricarboxylic transport membrane protein